jgi:hypothetical protein
LGGAGQPDGALDMRLSTLSGNTAGQKGGNLGSYTGQNGMLIDHAIIANGVPDDIAEAAVFADYTLIEHVANILVFGSHNLLGADPLLGPLANNGGPTQTHVPLPGSPVIDAGDPAIPDPPPTDQRGFPRIVGPAVDLGSVEAQASVLEVPTLSQAGIFLLSALLLAAGVWKLRTF